MTFALVTDIPPLPDDKPTEVDRIASLDEREPYDTEIDLRTGKYPPRTEKLIDEETAKYGKARLSCACRDRVVEGLGGGRLLVYHEAEPRDEMPPVPLDTTVDKLVADAVGTGDEINQFRKVLYGIRPGQMERLPGLGHPTCLKRMNAVQAWLLRELPDAEGAVGRASVGSGKTFYSILAALALRACRTAVLLAKPSQRLHYRIEYLRMREHFRVPWMIFDNSDSFPVTGAPKLHFVPYSMLSNPKHSTYLESIEDLDLVVSDESHLLANRSAARSIRFLRVMSKRPNVIFVPSSGSFVNRSVSDASHLFAHALGTKSPYPIPPEAVESFSAVLDPQPMPDTTSTVAIKMREAFGDVSKQQRGGVGALLFGNEDIRKGFARKSERVLGVITTRGSSAPCSIEISEWKAPAMPTEVKKALAGVRQEWLRPDGEELVEQLEQAQCVREVAFGYYNHFRFPNGEPAPLIDEWFSARKPYHRQLRQKILLGEPLLDSPKLCSDAAIRAWLDPRYDGNLPVWPAESWPAWARVKDLVKPISNTAFVGDELKRGDAEHPGYFIARAAAEWAKSHRGVVWVQSVALGRLIARLSKLAYHGGGPNAEARILGLAPASDGVIEKGQRSIIASMDAHAESRNGLQFMFSEMLIVEIPGSSKGFEQILGRLARPGQKEDTVKVELCLHVFELTDAFRKAYRDAEFVQTTATNRQMLLAADGVEEILG